ncbi:MAG: glycerol-3-phosphate 1-O-acyltransferase PlsY [Rickettsiales bacterium]
MDNATIITLVCIMSYLVGSIPCGFLLAYSYQGQLITKKGSGNIGTTNAMRVAGKAVGIATMISDVLKGVIPTMLAANLFQHNTLAVLLCAFLALVGHMYPVWLKFNGGKGVATSLGILIVIEPTLALLAACLFALIAIPFRLVSVASLTTSLMVAIAAFFISTPQIAIFLISITGLIFLKHKENIERIFKGEEKKLF